MECGCERGEGYPEPLKVGFLSYAEDLDSTFFPKRQNMRSIHGAEPPKYEHSFMDEFRVVLCVLICTSYYVKLTVG